MALPDTDVRAAAADILPWAHRFRILNARMLKTGLLPSLSAGLAVTALMTLSLCQAERTASAMRPETAPMVTIFFPSA
jgi:hypothetical protein